MYSDYPITGKSNKKQDQVNNYVPISKKKEESNNNYIRKKTIEEIGFEKTQKKMKITIFKNGFIIDYGEFRDKRIPENQKFLESIEKGYIPKELMKKGLKNLGIIIENRKKEEYITNSIPSNPLPYEQKNINTNTDNIYQNIYSDNIYIKNNINPTPIFQQDNNYPYTEINQQQKYYKIEQKQDYQSQNPIYEKYKYNSSNINYNFNKNNINKKREKTPKKDDNKLKIGNNPLNNNDYLSKTPIREREIDNDIFPDKVIEPIKPRAKKSFGRTRSKNFKTFQSFIKREQDKEDEKLAKKGYKMIQNTNAGKEVKKEENTEQKKDEKKFVPFEGLGYFLGNVNVEGLKVNKDFKNQIDRSLPICNFNVRLFNGEIVKCEFNLTQKLSDIYIYISHLSGSKNFVLLDGFPPKPLNQFNLLIKDLKLDNTTLTQKIN
jgi:hypothetical protein